jgi:hypothetical protein
MNGNQSLGSAAATLGVVFLAVAISLLLLHFLPTYFVIVILGFLASILGLCAVNTSQSKLAFMGGLVIVFAAVLLSLFLSPTSASNLPNPIRSGPTISP